MPCLPLGPLRLLGLPLLLIAQAVHGFYWAPARAHAAVSNSFRTQPVQATSESMDPFSVALRELQALESEPLCHRIAARLLVNNCELLDGRDEATVLTDSGREARDFVDSYAASLAICDLERGSFRIPPSCNKFREAILSTMTAPMKPNLHVSTSEIDACLEGLAQSDSAWNTWVSYRHKALRFCEAARADNQKDHDIHIHQRVTKILEEMTDSIEKELEHRLASLNQAWTDTAHQFDNLAPKVDNLQKGFESLDTISKTLHQHMADSAHATKQSINEAATLQKLIAMLVGTMLEQNAELAASYESSLQVVTHPMNRDLVGVVETMASAIAASASLHNEIERSRIQVSEIARKHDIIESKLDGLDQLADDLSTRQSSHSSQLLEASEVAQHVLETLESVVTSTNHIQTSWEAGSSIKQWWPYIFCPALSLVMGSYGLEPSAVRNMALVGLGELAGFVISTAQPYVGDFYQRAHLLSTWPRHGHHSPYTNGSIVSSDDNSTL